MKRLMNEQLILPVALVVLVTLGLVAGTFGALLGLGGSILLVPVLTLMGIPTGTAAAIGLVCVVATSSSASSVYLERGWADVRVGLPLQLATVLGALSGAWVAPLLPAALFKLLFASFLFYAAWLLWRRPETTSEDPEGVITTYQARNRGLGAGVCYLAGNVSGILGIGGGPVQVPLMHLGMGLPMKVSTATSNFMMGMTATAAALLYYQRGQMVVGFTAPLALGVFLGAQIGSRLARRVHSRILQRLLIAVLVVLAAGLLWNAAGLMQPQAGGE